jgi:hypothetical protein
MLMFSGGKRAEASLLRLWWRAKIPHGFLPDADDDRGETDFDSIVAVRCRNFRYRQSQG